jgi:hypothetical protein
LKRFYHVGWLLLFICCLLAGCNNGSEQVKADPKKEQTPPTETKKEGQEEKSNEPDAPKGTPEWDLQQIEKAVEDNDQALFMSYQNKENPTFYKEQQRWIEEAIFKKEQGYQLSLDLFNFHEENDSTGIVDFKVTMSHPNFNETSNIVKYQAIKVKDKWLLNDVPFKKISSRSGNITVYYSDGQQDTAQKTLKDATDIVSFYTKTFNWKPGPVSIKVYPSRQEVSATVPWIALSGWNEFHESIKITSELTSEIFRFLAHELTHKMLSDLTHDNASLYIQEGFATFLEASVKRDQAGKISFDLQKAKSNAAKAIEVSNSVQTIEELGEIDYTDPTAPMYRDGALLSNYLIQTKGIDKFFEMLHYLASFEYIDKRLEHKLKTCNDRTVEAIEKVYGYAEKISSDEIKYYVK